MPRNRFILACAVSLLAAANAAACPCDISLSACNEAAVSNLVFIGTVEAIEPGFLSRWSQRAGAPLQLFNDAYAQARQTPSPATLASLKDAVLKVLPALPSEERERLAAADSAPAVMALFNDLSDHGLKVRFKVRTLFKRQADDDDKDDDKDDKARKDDDDDAPPATLEVSTPFGDCGFDFQPGETYLVYANGEEGAATYFTGSCTRTSRLSDAADDLALLFFLKNTPAAASRLEGFATTDPHYQLDFNPLKNPDTIAAPAPGAMIELSSVSVTRDTPADRKGRFIFDGLAEGDYQLAAYAPGYPSITTLLSGPARIHIGPNSCARQILLLRRND